MTTREGLRDQAESRGVGMAEISDKKNPPGSWSQLQAADKNIEDKQTELNAATRARQDAEARVARGEVVKNSEQLKTNEKDARNRLEGARQARQVAQESAQAGDAKLRTQAASGEVYRHNAGFNLDDKAESEDDCAYSGTYGSKHSCNSTKTWVEGAKITNTVTMAAGAAAVSIGGQNDMQRAAQGGGQADALDAAARSQKRAGDIQVTTGTTNLALGVMQLWRGWGHNSEKKRIQGELKKESSAVTSETFYGHSKRDEFSGDLQVKGSAGVDAFKLNTIGTVVDQSTTSFKGADGATALTGIALDNQRIANRIHGFDEKKADIAGALGTIGRKVGKEQNAAAEQANQGGLMSLMAGLPQMIQGAFAKKAAKETAAAADKLRDAESKVQSAFQAPNFGTNEQSENTGAGQSTVITGNAEVQNPVVAEEEQKKDDEDSADLGTGFAPGGVPEGTLGPGPVAQVAGSGNGGGAAMGGGGGVGGGGTGPGEQTGEAEQGPRYAANMETPGSGYQSGGGGYASGGGGSGGGGGADLSGMLDKLMGKLGGGETEFKGKPSLEAYGRGLASESYSYLDKTVNIFDRIHQAYQAKSKTGHVGL